MSDWYKRIPIYEGAGGEYVDPGKVRKLEADFIEAIEALRGETLNTEKSDDGWDYYRNIQIIEKAYGKSWDEIKEMK